MNLTEVKTALADKKNFNAYIKGTERVRVVGTTEKMVKVNVYDGARLVRNDNDTYVVKNVKPESLTLSKEKASSSNNKAKGVFQVVANDKVISTKELSWTEAKELFKAKAEKGAENDVFAIVKLVDGVASDKPSMTKTIKKRASKARSNEYVVRVEGNEVTEKDNFATTLASFKERSAELVKNEEWGTKIEMVKFGKDDKETLSREVTITEPVIEVEAEPIAENTEATEQVEATETEKEVAA